MLLSEGRYKPLEKKGITRTSKCPSARKRESGHADGGLEATMEHPATGARRTCGVLAAVVLPVRRRGVIVTTSAIDNGCPSA